MPPSSRWCPESCGSRSTAPRAYGSSIGLTGSADATLWGFLAFYVTCAALTYAVYTRRGGLLHDIEHGRTGEPVTAVR